MKNTITFLLFIILVFLLAACGGSEGNQTQDVQSQDSEQLGFSGEMTLQSKLFFGSFMLEETDLAITPKQAEELLPLWQLYKSLLESDTAAEVEIDAVIDAIQAAMTDDQIAYIEAMQFGSEEFRQLMEDFDISFGFRGGKGDTGDTPSGDSPGGFGGVPGQGLGGGKGSGQGFDRDFQNLSPEQQATAQALRSERGGGGRGIFGNPTLFDALIELLEGKIG